ncbi:hypothetical protein Neosp_008261 [[Neocosmospora] mangrovei]
MEEYMQDLLYGLDEDASEIEHTPEADDLENAHTPDDDATVDEHTSDEEVPEDVVALDEVVPPAPTTPDRPIQQHPLPPTINYYDIWLLRTGIAFTGKHGHTCAGLEMLRPRTRGPD